MQNVALSMNVDSDENGNIYYEQYNTICCGAVKTGDYVYVATESGKQSIAQIHMIWETKEYALLFYIFFEKQK